MTRVTLDNPPSKPRKSKKQADLNLEPVTQGTVFEMAKKVLSTGNCETSKTYLTDKDPGEAIQDGNKRIEVFTSCDGGKISRYSKDDVVSVLYGKSPDKKGKGATEDTVIEGTNPEFESKIKATGKCETVVVEYTTDATEATKADKDVHKETVCDGGRIIQSANGDLQVIVHGNGSDTNCNSGDKCKYYNFLPELNTVNCIDENSKPCKKE